MHGELQDNVHWFFQWICAISVLCDPLPRENNQRHGESLKEIEFRPSTFPKST